MKLTRFKAKNIFSIGEVDFDLDKRGLLLITGQSIDDGGANGSGKSSISSKGVLWTLYGSTAAGERADAVRNRFAPEDETSFGSVELESSGGNHYRITRSRCPSRLSLHNLDSGEDLSARQEKDTQELINKILGRNKDTFLQTDFFGQGKQAAFMELTPKAQMELLESILPFERINELADSTKRNLNRINIISDSIQRHITETSGKLMEAQKSERTLSDSVDNWDITQEATIMRLTQELAEAEAASEINKSIKAIQDELTDMPTPEEAEDAKAQAQAGVDLCTASLREYRMALSDWQAERDAIPRFPAPNVTCPTCNAPTNEAAFVEMWHRHDEMEGKLYLTDEAIKNIKEYIPNIELALQGWERSRKDAEKVISRHQQLSFQLARLDAERATDKQAIIKEKLKSVKENVNPYTELYNTAVGNAKTLVSTLNFHKQREQEVQKDLDALEFWQGAFAKDLKNEFINQVCPFLQEKAIIHLEGLGNAQLKVKVETTKTLKSSDTRSEFTVSALSTCGGGNYDSLSGGERQMVNFAFGLALADLAELQVDGPSYFMVLDEPFMALDARNAENLVNYLTSYLAGKKETILLISNEESLKSLIPNKVLVVKENGMSRLENYV